MKSFITYFLAVAFLYATFSWFGFWIKWSSNRIDDCYHLQQTYFECYFDIFWKGHEEEQLRELY